MAQRNYGRDLKSLGKNLRRGIGRAGAGVREQWKDLEPKLQEGSEQVGRAAGDAFKKIGTSLRRLPDRFRDGGRSGGAD